MPGLTGEKNFLMKDKLKENFLDAFLVFRKAPEGLVDEILDKAHNQTVPARVNVYSEGDTCSSIAFLLSGEIRVYKTGENGREITLYELGPGETCILNASCILSNTSYPANAVTLSDCDVILIPAPDFRRLMGSSMEMREFVFKVLADRLSSVMALVEEVTFARMDERLMDYLVEKSDNGKLVTTHQKIASDLGTSREVVSRLLKDFERKGRLTLSRNLIQITTNPTL